MKLLKFLIALLLLMPLVIVIGYMSHNEVIRKEYKGTISTIIWESDNHNMIRIVLVDKGKTIVFESYRISLTPEHISRGDKFEKVKGTKNCIINELEVQCIR